RRGQRNRRDQRRSPGRPHCCHPARSRPEVRVQPRLLQRLAGNVSGSRHYGSMAGESPLTGTDPLEGFSPATRAWFDGAFAEPTQAQAGAWRAIGKGEDTLVVAPTGSGKTLAAFLWAIDKLAAVRPPADPKRRTRALYVSPLKA